MMFSFPIKLAFCITELNIGGAERAMCELAVRLDKSRFSVTVYSLQAPPDCVSKSCVPMLEAAKIPVQFLNMHGLQSFPAGFFRLRKLLKEQQPAIFLSYLFHANFLGRLVARSVGVKHIFSGIRVAEKKAAWHLLFDRWTNRWVEKNICVSHSVAEFTETVGRLAKEKIIVIPNGIDIAPINEINNKKLNRVIFIGRLTYQKGVDWFLETTPDWLGQLPDWECWIVGDGEDHNRLINILYGKNYDSVRNRIKFSGWRSDILELLVTSKILVLPSRWEGMPNVVLQAMSVRLPVVATEVEGISELLGENITSQTCKFGDNKTMTERILTLATNSDLAEWLGNQNREQVQKFFSIDAVVRRYEKLFVPE
ncbi:MAG: glycosyltransferase [Planctomycetaceae bacterium]|jgi:glycosyltransferase involved in cell wall biosynthesis|nr:glycosyltransferase [Planctomycetaceae bacterium]